MVKGIKKKITPPKDLDLPMVKSEYCSVKKSVIHGRGVYAKKFIPEGTRVIQYVGEKITKAESDRRADIALENNKLRESEGAVYIFTLNKKYDIDGYVTHNTARYINHSCEPNCETDIIRGKIWIVALRDIKKGKEITYNYGYDLDSYKDHPCECGSKKCVGYIVAEEHWPKLKRKLQKKHKKKDKK